ncbi:MAG: hypothetical protein MJZ76_08070 [Bacteroidales bacterium]|nr:hypothetical protein [Bacteroidales bacterium]
MKKTVLVLLTLLIFSPIFAQIPIGTFRDWLPKSDYLSVALNNNFAYAASENGVLYVDKTSETANFWSKVDGLSDGSVSGCYASEKENLLAIAYTNANIDFIKDDKVINVADIMNKSIVGSKKINKIVFINNDAYVLCDFGVVVIGLKNFLIKETWFTNLDDARRVKDLVLFENQFYLFTNSGCLTINSNQNNIADINTWQQVPEFGNTAWHSAKLFNDGIVVASGDEAITSLHFFKNDTLTSLSEIALTDLRFIDTRDNELLMCTKAKVIVYDSQWASVFSSTDWWAINYEDARMALLDKDHTIWIADANNGLVHLDRKSGKKSFYKNGPISNQSFRMDCKNGTLAITPGSCATYNAPKYIAGGLSVVHNNQWTLYKRIDIPELFSINATDFCCAAINPRNSKEIYVGSWKDGLFHFSEKQAPEQFTPDNSSLQYSTLHPGSNFTLISDLAFDGNNNLWMTNSFCNYPLSVLKSDKTWQHFNLYAGSASAVGRLCIDSRGYKWLTIRNSDKTWKLVVFTENGTISNTSDDKINTANLNDYCNVNTSSLSCLVEDLDGKIWIGTEQGVKVIYNAASAFQTIPYAQNILIDANGNTQNLLEFESITDIEVDDANRKWIGTEKSGVFLVSSDGTKELLHFTTDNSPLYSNTINDIAINRENGEVFFATSLGVISYQGTATKGKEDFEEISVFPNPVREGYNGIIAVRGLMQNAFCKIANASGHLVWQGYADGGQLNWDGKDFYGKRPATGVYFVFASDKTGKEKEVAKILFIK